MSISVMILSPSRLTLTVIHSYMVAVIWYVWRFRDIYRRNADPSGRAVKGMGLRPLACCDCGF